MDVSNLWRERNRCLTQLCKILKIEAGFPDKVRMAGKSFLEEQRKKKKVDPVLEYLVYRLNFTRNELFKHYRQEFKSYFNKAKRLHEDGEQILAEELIMAIDKADMGADDTSFRIYFRTYRIRAFRKILELLEDKGVCLSRTCLAKMRAIRKIENKILAQEGREITEEDIKEIAGDGNSTEILKLFKSRRVELFIEDEEGNISDRTKDDLSPETLLLFKEEFKEQEKNFKVPEESRIMFDKMTQMFWWEWDRVQRERSPEKTGFSQAKRRSRRKPKKTVFSSQTEKDRQENLSVYELW